MNTIRLRENGPPIRVQLTDTAAAEIVRLGVADVSPMGKGEWSISAAGKVGAVRLLDTELRIEPKVPLNQLFFILSRTFGWDLWREETLKLSTVDDLYPAIFGLFARSAERTVRSGIFRAYRERRSSENFIRGRWLVTEQIRTRQGLQLPAELLYDEFTANVDENRLLRSAARRLMRASDMSPALRRRIYKLDAQLDDAGVLAPGAPLPQIRFDRRNDYYRTALGLARLILEHQSIDRGVAEITGAGFLLNMPVLFERFIEAEVVRSAAAFGGLIKPQKRDYLDQGAQVVVKPDLVWVRGDETVSVIDAKYKAEKPAGHPNADIYQMLAYCIRHKIGVGHLVYAAGNERPTEYVVEQAGVTVVCHAIALDAEPGEIIAQVDRLVARSYGDWGRTEKLEVT